MAPGQPCGDVESAQIRQSYVEQHEVRVECSCELQP